MDEQKLYIFYIQYLGIGLHCNDNYFVLFFAHDKIIIDSGGLHGNDVSCRMFVLLCFPFISQLGTGSRKNNLIHHMRSS